MRELRSEYISKRLFLAMMIILLSLLLISVPLIIRSYQSFQKNQQAQVELETLRILADLANQISRERAPSNNLMSSNADQQQQRVQELYEYRKNVDQHLEITIQALSQSGFYRVASYLDVQFKPKLNSGRDAVDAYDKLPLDQKNVEALDFAIQQMFLAWDGVHEALQMVVNQSHGKETAVSHYYTLILLLAELRDQAGRAGSNVMAAVSFDEPIAETNMARFLQSKRQSQYLWELTGVLLPEHDKTEQFIALHRQLKSEFLDQAIPMIDKLVNESLQDTHDYSMSSVELTTALSSKFSTVVDLQSYMLDYSIEEAQRQTQMAYQQFMTAISMTLIAIITTFFSMFYLRNYVFEPLIRARRMLLELSQSHAHKELSDRDSTSLFVAIQHLQEMLRQRDHMEFKLKNLANTDSLTGVANRFALDEYIKVLESQPTQFSQTCLIVVDIDHFKQVNDQYGHILGDQVIRWVAETLIYNVRATDLLVRYGGDEFLVLIEHIDLIQALNIADKIRAEIVMGSFMTEDDEAISVSVSIGVAVGASSWLDLLEKADRALFRAKAAGRNAVSG